MWLVVEDVVAGIPYYLSTDAPVAIDSDGHWESRVTFGTGRGDIGRDYKLTAIVVPDHYFDDEIAERPHGQYSVRLMDYPPDAKRASVDVMLCDFTG